MLSFNKSMIKTSNAFVFTTILTFAASIFTFIQIAISSQFEGANIGGGMLFFLGIILGIVSVFLQPKGKILISLAILVVTTILIYFLINYISSLETFSHFTITQ